MRLFAFIPIKLRFFPNILKISIIKGSLKTDWSSINLLLSAHKYLQGFYWYLMLHAKNTVWQRKPTKIQEKKLINCLKLRYWQFNLHKHYQTLILIDCCNAKVTAKTKMLLRDAENHATACAFLECYEILDFNEILE